MLFIISCRKAVLPIEIAIEVNRCDDEDTANQSTYQQLQVAERLKALKEGIYKKAQSNIKASQKRMKKDYDKKHYLMKVGT